MEKLINYLNALNPEDRIAFGRACNTSEGYLRKACSARQKLGADICVRIEEESGGQITRRDLRADWSDIWPELRDAPEPKQMEAAA